MQIPEDYFPEFSFKKIALALENDGQLSEALRVAQHIDLKPGRKGVLVDILIHFFKKQQARARSSSLEEAKQHLENAQTLVHLIPKEDPASQLYTEVLAELTQEILGSTEEQKT